MPPDVNNWKQIKGYPEYRISRMGRVYSTYRKIYIYEARYKEWILCGKLFQKRGSKPFYIHRLVAIAYIELVYGRSFVNHKDGDKLDNDVANLEW